MRAIVALSIVLLLAGCSPALTHQEELSQAEFQVACLAAGGVYEDFVFQPPGCLFTYPDLP